MTKIYDTIGVDYSTLRKSDPHITAAIEAGLGDAKTVVNVGAGAGSYEPADRRVTAVEPSQEMISQRVNANPVIQGVAENLPFDDNAFDAAMATLTVHHWADKQKGLAEMRRVARERVVILTFDAYFDGFWLVDYFPALQELDKQQMPLMSDYSDWLGPVEISEVPIPAECTDGFLCAYWQRPEAYLDEKIRTAISSFWKIGDLTEGLARLEADLDSGRWEDRYGQLRALETLDCGYRLVVSHG